MDAPSAPAGPSNAPTVLKSSKFKPAIAGPSRQESSRRTMGLNAFSTPGFQTRKQYPPHPQEKQDAISISSDSAPSTPGGNSVKRHSSGLSLADDPSPPLKRTKKMPYEDKENIFQSSSAVGVIHHTPEIQALESTATLEESTSPSLQTLMKHQIYALDLSKFFTQESLAYHSGTDSKDIELIETIKSVIDTRLETIDGKIKQNRRRNNTPAFNPISTTLSAKTSHGSKTLTRDTSVIVDNARYETPYIETSKIEIDYWKDIEEIPMEEDCPAPATTSASVQEMIQSGKKTDLTLTPFYEEIQSQLHNIFKLSDFRPNQLGAITATLEGKDVFVLMPTGGGKSLCYQLPAVCTTGKTKGVTVVVSPLLALMKDQVDSLIKKNINALLSNSETGGDDWNRLVTCRLKPSLWYVTPEKLRDSGRVNDILAKLYKDQSLARFVIDEAHCISTWGQDFRDAYTSLGSLRDKYPDVPIMALTATANKRTVCDIISQLQLREDHTSFTQSFNRTNLSYTVKTKRGNPTNEIINFINTSHEGHAGIIYCQARSTCETVAKNLRERGLGAAHFHAGMTTPEKDKTIHDWQIGAVSVIVATIAFGMGIDKANVRFVIHYDMPKTLSGYYQETGRAGRDGKPAECLMWHDLYKLRNQIQKSEDTTEESKRRQEAAVKEVYEFCKKISVCRRVQLLRHFDEDFDREMCAKGCDTCQDDRQTVSRDVTTYARDGVHLAKRLMQDKITFVQFGNILRGSKAADIVNKGLDKFPEYGSCNDLPKELFDLMLDELLYLGLLTKVATQNASGFHTEYLSIGESATNFLRGKEPVRIDWRPTANSKSSAKQPRQRKAVAPYAVDAPFRSKKGKNKIVEEDPIECYDDMYDDDFDASHLDCIPELNNATFNAQSSVSTAHSSSASFTANVNSSKSTHPGLLTKDPAEELYKKMVELRDEIMLHKGISNPNEVFPDNVLEYLSLVCPSDYNAFKQELICVSDMEGPEADAYANNKWNEFGQKFLRLCIQHKTFKLNPSAAPVPHTNDTLNPITLPSRFEYKAPPISGSGSVSTLTPMATSSKPKSKFKPSVRS